MDSFSMIRFFALLFFAFISCDALATTFPLNVPGVSVTDYGELVYSFRGGAPQLVYPELQTTAPLTVPPSGPFKGANLPVPVKIGMNASRAAGVLVRLAKFTSPLSIGLTAVSLLCEVTSICQSSSDPSKWVKIDPLNVSHSDLSSTMDCSLTPVGTDRYVYVNNDIYHVWAIEGDPPSPYHINNCLEPGKKFYGLYRQVVNVVPDANESPIQPSDWDDAVTKLVSKPDRYPDIKQSLDNNSVPVPINPPVVIPTSVTSPPETTITRDDQGNPISSGSKTTTTSVSPAPFNPPASNPGASANTNPAAQKVLPFPVPVTVTQTTVINDYHSDGSLSSSTTSSGEPPPPPEDTDIEFDSVSDVELPRQDLTPSLNTQSWGEGTCPPDPTLSVRGTSLTVPVHVVCNYMTQIRGAVILVFAIIAAYIVVGVNKGSG